MEFCASSTVFLISLNIQISANNIYIRSVYRTSFNGITVNNCFCSFCVFNGQAIVIHLHEHAITIDIGKSIVIDSKLTSLVLYIQESIVTRDICAFTLNVLCSNSISSYSRFSTCCIFNSNPIATNHGLCTISIDVRNSIRIYSKFTILILNI